MTPSAPAPARQRSRSFTSSFFTTNAGKPRRDPPPWAEPLEGRVLLADTLALVKDINDASLGTFQPYNTSGSSATQVTEVNGTVFFAANDRLLGKELWRTDGTPEGTRLVKDINPGGRWSMPVGLTNVNGTLFFYADDGVHGYELWKSDGSAAGTYMVEDIVAGPVGSKAPTDGSSPPDIMTAAFGDLYLFTTRTRTQVWRSDGTGTGTYPLRDIVVNPIPEFSFPGRFGVSNGVAYFQSHDEVAGWEIWKTDGTREGTTRLADLLPGPASSMPDGFVSGPNGLTYFSARSPTNPSGRDLYRTDGTAEGTILLRSMMGAPPDAHVMGGELYFAATRNEVWVTDGTPAGTTRVLAFDIDPAAGDGQQVTVLGLMNGRLLIYG